MYWTTSFWNIQKRSIRQKDNDKDIELKDRDEGANPSSDVKAD
jgi:hypothetical protein